MERIKKNDMVMVRSGKDKGKKGKVIAILPKKGKVMVKDVALVTKHQKARKQGETAGIKKLEAFIPLDKVMPICGACNVPTRVSAQLQGESRVRICKRCHESF